MYTRKGSDGVEWQPGTHPLLLTTTTTIPVCYGTVT